METLEKYNPTENAEMRTMPTTEMRNAFTAFAEKFNGESVGSRDTFYHGWVAAVSSAKVATIDDVMHMADLARGAHHDV